MPHEHRTTRTDKRNTATYKTVNYSIFANAVSKLAITPAKLSEAIGYSPHTHIGWKGRKEMPKTAGLACECLLRRNQIEEDKPEPTTLFFLLVPNKHKLAFEAFTNALDGINSVTVPLPGEG